MGSDRSIARDPGTALADLRAEQAVLGAVLLAAEDAPRVYELARLHLRCSRRRGVGGRWAYEGDFSEPRNAVIFSCMGAVLARGEPLDALTLLAELRRAGGGEADEVRLLNTVGGAAYVSDLIDAVPTAAHVEAHAKIVADCAAARRLVEAFEDGARALRSGGPPAVGTRSVSRRARALRRTATATQRPSTSSRIRSDVVAAPVLARLAFVMGENSSTDSDTV